MPARARASERGAALLAVLAMVVLLAGFATLGLERLKAAGERITDAQAKSEARLLASSGTAAALSIATGLKLRARTRPELLGEPVSLPFADGEVEARFSDGGNCFNLNSLARPPASTRTEVPAAASPEDFARLLQATGIPLLEATTIARATADRLAATGQLWADGSEWTGVSGVTQRHWDLAGALLCALPTRDASTLNINALTSAGAPLLAGVGMGADQARRAVASRPAGGWTSSDDFVQQTAIGSDRLAAANDRLGTTSRWMALRITATTPRTTIVRELLIDTLPTPAEVVQSRWRAVEVPA